MHQSWVGNGLLYLWQQRFGIAHEEIADVLAVPELVLQEPYRTPRSMTVELYDHRLKETRLYITANRPKAPSRPMVAVSIAAPFSRTVNRERTEPCGK
jgi:hypothetical protein